MMSRIKVMNSIIRPTHWTPTWRTIIFVLAATSIWCLLAEMYHLCSMQFFTLWILITETTVLGLQ